MKLLILRFSSFGDVLQSLSVAGRVREVHPDAEIQWVTRHDFVPLIESNPAIAKVWSIHKGQGIFALLALAEKLKRENFTHIYDVHNNLRSRLICASLNGFLGWRRLLKHRFLRRSIRRWKRFLLFRLRVNRFEQPFSGQRDLLEPLAKWGISFQLPKVPQFYLGKVELPKGLPHSYVALAPSAAFPLKRWPIEHWRSLIGLFPAVEFVVLGGIEDTFLSELEGSGRVHNWAGRLSLLQSARVVMDSQALVANDTGLMHVAEQTGKACVALMGPAPFGFPSRPSTRVQELKLWCRPCSKHGQGPCVNPEFQKCLRDISPEQVAGALRGILDA